MDLIPKQFKPKIAQASGLKSRGISIIEGKRRLAFLLEKRLFILEIIFIVCLIAFGAMKGYEFFVKKDINNIQAQIDAIKQRQDLDQAQKYIETEKTAGTVQELENNHIRSSLFFEVLEKNTLPQVQWLSLNLNNSEDSASLRGRAQSYSLLAHQIEKFEEASITTVISAVNLTINGVEFSAALKFEHDILLKK